MSMGIKQAQNPWVITILLLGIFLFVWQLLTLRPPFDSTGKTEEELTLLQFNGDIIQNEDGQYVWNPEKEKVKGIPGPFMVVEKMLRGSIPH